MTPLRTALAGIMIVTGAGASAGSELTMPYALSPPIPAQPGVSETALTIVSATEWLRDRPCRSGDNVVATLGTRTIAVPSGEIASLRIARQGRRSSCPGDAVEAEAVAVTIGTPERTILVTAYPTRSNLAGTVAAARTQAPCSPGVSAGLDTCIVDQSGAAVAVALDRAGPVDEFENPPAVLCVPGLARPICFQPVLHPSGLLAVVPVTGKSGMTVERMRATRIEVLAYLGARVTDATVPGRFDPGHFAPTNAPQAAKALALPVDARGVARGDILRHRRCGATAPVRLRIGGAEFDAPLAQVDQVRFGPTTRTLDDQRKAIDLDASCPDAPLHLRSAYLVDGDVAVVLAGAGRGLRAESQARVARLRKGECTPVSDTVVGCTLPGEETSWVLRSTGSDTLRLDALCRIGSDSRETCEIGGESSLGYAYTLPASPEPQAQAAVIARLTAGYRMLKGLGGRSVQASREAVR